MQVEASEVSSSLSEVQSQHQAWDPLATPVDPSQLSKAVELLASAKAPLLVFGKGAAYAQAEAELRSLVEGTGLPFLATPMGKGVVPDTHPLSAAAARSLVLKGADVVVVVGARLNWILHFGEPPRWSPNVQFVVLDVVEDQPPSGKAANRHFVLGHAKTTVAALHAALQAKAFKVPTHL